MKVSSSFGQRSFHLIHLVLILCHDVAANTEIITFSSSREPTVDLPLKLVGNWSTLHPTDNEWRWSIEPAALHTPLHQVCESSADTAVSRTPFSCPHELWLLLDLDNAKWASHSTFTLRLSWPASTPADFAISLYAPQDLLARLAPFVRADASPHYHSSPSPSWGRGQAHTTRARYAHIRAVHAGVPTPGSLSHTIADRDRNDRPRAGANERRVPVARRRPAAAGLDRPGEVVPVIVILEPVYWGVLPATLLPTITFLVPIVLVAALVVLPWVTANLEPWVQQAREDATTTGVARAAKQR